MSTDL